jgi:hypothetical protein
MRFSQRYCQEAVRKGISLEPGICTASVRSTHPRISASGQVYGFKVDVVKLQHADEDSMVQGNGSTNIPLLWIV